MEKLSLLISDVRTIVRQAIEDVVQVESTPAHLQALADGAEKIHLAFLALGDYCYDFLEEQPTESEVDVLFLFACNYLWAADAKAFMILWRNILFEGKKAHILALEGLTDPKSASLLRGQAMAKLREMSETVTEGLAHETEKLRQGPKGGTAAIKKWRLQTNPWPVYREQMDQIPVQCADMVQSFMQLQHAVRILIDLRKNLLGTIDAAKEEGVQTRRIGEQALEAIEEETKKGEAARPGSLAARLEHIQEQLLLPNHLNQFLSSLEEAIEPLPEKVTVTVEARAGMLHIIEANFQRRTEKWLETNVFPLLYEVWEITEGSRNGTKMAIVNVHNRALVLASEDKEQKTHDLRGEALGEPLHLFSATIDNSEMEFDALHSLIAERLDQEFKVGLIFRGEPGFISGPAPSSFDQFGRNRFMRDLVAWSRKQVRRVQNFIRRVEEEEALSVSEKIVRYIESRNGNGIDSQYASIFLTRGYIGESFCVGRDNEIAHFAKLVDQWNLGYRGSVCLTGNRFSGKSLFGELVAHRYFPDSAIRIAPGETIRVEGRKVVLDYDLEKTLNEIRKLTLNRRPLIWIDDLELWWHPSVPLNKNVRALRRYLDHHASDMFFMVSMSNAMRSFLQRFHHLDRLFQAEINMDRMNAADIRAAIWVRHGATNRKLVDQEGKEVNPQHFTRLTNRIHRASRGNVGEALNMWSLSTHPAEYDTVTNDYVDNYALPDFITPDSGLLLAYIMVQKKTKEYHLVKLFGPAYKEKYAHIMKRLLSVGLLERQLDDFLEINRAVVNDLGELLEHHDYLNYQKWKS